MNESQKAKIAPHWEVIKLAYDTKQWIGGREALQVMNQVNIELGNMPTTFNCGGCIMELIKLTYNNYTNGK